MREAVFPPVPSFVLTPAAPGVGVSFVCPVCSGPEVAQSGYVGGKVDFLNVIDAERTLLDFRLSEVEARLQRELALAELSLLILGVPPANAPVLPPKAAHGKEGKP